MSDERLCAAAESILRLLPLWKAKMLRPLEHTAPSGLSGMQFWILAMVGELEAVPVGEVAKHMMISKSNITAVVDKLVSADLVERLPRSDDRRVVNVRITPSGRELLESQEQAMMESISQKLAGLPDDKLDELTVALTTVYEIISETP